MVTFVWSFGIACVLSCSTGTLYIVLVLPKLGKLSHYVYKRHVVTLCGSLEYNTIMFHWNSLHCVGAAQTQ